MWPVAEQVAIVGEYFRSLRGDVIHLAPCSRMGNAVRWIYAETLSLNAVVAEVNSIDWMRLCRRCWPAEALSWSADTAAGAPNQGGTG